MTTLPRKIRRAYQWSRFQWERATLSERHDSVPLAHADFTQLRAQLERLGKIFWRDENLAPANRAERLVAADEICAHVFDLLGSGKVRVDHQLQAQGFAGHRYRMPISEEKLAQKRRRFKSYVEDLQICSSNVILEGSSFAPAKPPIAEHAVHTNETLSDYNLIDWFVDFRSGYRWKEKLWHQSVPHGHQPGVDIKVPWELARFQHLATLGHAYRATNAAKYANEFALQIWDWIFHNPQSCGLHWARAMEVALRAMHWIFSAHFFAHAPELRPRFWNELLRSLFRHGAFIRSHLEISRDRHGRRLTANHYLANVAGLVLLGILFHQTREGQEWLSFGVRELNNEMQSQVYSDGVHFEASTHYHKLAAELFLCATRAALHHGIPFERDYLERLKKMIKFLRAVLKPNGTLPLLGDDDASGLAIFNTRRDAHRVRSSAEIFLSRIDEVFDERLSRAEKDSLRMTNLETKHCALTSNAFSASGIYILRHRDDYLITDCGPCGQNGNGGHAHNDSLSFELSAGGEDFILDPGTFTYTADEKGRNHFRSTAMHNVVMVDEEEMQPFKRHELFALPENAPPQVLAFETHARYDYLAAEHYGYTRLHEPIVHRRHFLFNKEDRFWLIRDEMLGRGTHRYCLHLHLAPCAIRASPEELCAQAEQRGVRLAVFPYRNGHIRMQLATGWIAPRYGVRFPGTVLQYFASGIAPLVFVTIFHSVHDDDFNCKEARAQVERFCERIHKTNVLLTE